ncbi:MAG: hypothetical protein ABIH37_02285 [archaeon]
MKQKEIVIIVPGAAPLTKYPIFIRYLFFSILYFLRIKPIKEDHADIWGRKLLRKNGFIWFYWSRKVDNFSLKIAERRLKKVLDSYKNKNIKLVGISIGGQIILETLMKKSYDNVSKIIFIGSINGYHKINFKHKKIINLYSKKDFLTYISIKILSPFHGSRRLYGKNIKNIILPNLTHNQICSDAKVEKGRFKGKSITQIITQLLRD